MAQLTEFGVSVKKRLIDIGKNQEWLISEVKSRTGMFMDSSYLNKLMTGRATSAPMVNAIKHICGMEES